MQHAIHVLSFRLGTLDCHETMSSDSVELEKIQAQKDSIALAILELELLELKKQVKEQEGKIEAQKRRCELAESRVKFAEEGYRFISCDEPPEEGDEVKFGLGLPWELCDDKYNGRSFAYMIRRKIP